MDVFKQEAKFVFEFSKNTKPSYSRKNSLHTEPNLHSARGSLASSESRSRSRNNSSGVMNESQMATNTTVVRKCVTHKDNREKV